MLKVQIAHAKCALFMFVDKKPSIIIFPAVYYMFNWWFMKYIAIPTEQITGKRSSQVNVWFFDWLKLSNKPKNSHVDWKITAAHAYLQCTFRLSSWQKAIISVLYFSFFNVWWHKRQQSIPLFELSANTKIKSNCNFESNCKMRILVITIPWNNYSNLNWVCGFWGKMFFAKTTD